MLLVNDNGPSFTNFYLRLDLSFVIFIVMSDPLCFLSLGSLASSIFDPLKYLVGASGGVYALMGGYFMNVVVVRTLGMESMDFFFFKTITGI